MGLTCNIDRRGKRVRAILGVILVLGALGFAAGAWMTGRYVAFGLPAGMALLAGLFGLFEAANGWCAVRAMGYKTPL